MVNTADFYKHTMVMCDMLNPLGKRITSLLDDVVEKLPDEEQFKITGMIRFDTRQTASEFWQQFSQQWGHTPDFSRVERDGNCEYHFSYSNRADDRYIITIIVNELDSRTDDYIKGLIVHELSEMSYPFRKLQENWDSLKKMKPKARQVMMNKFTKSTNGPGSKEYQEHEDEVNNEAIRLGFQKEIDALLAKN
tara:strand:- start:38 stop:616 length:579 start_codon:yes stop_codon:yes gene_type:complete